MSKLDEIYAYVMTDDDGEEGVAFFETAGGTKITMIAPDRRSADAMAPIAKAIVRVHGRSLKLARFSKRQDLEELQL